MDAVSERLLDTPLDDCPLTFLDLETTGLSARFGDRVCEVAAVRFCGQLEVGRLSTLVDPRRPISPGARAVNGISSEMVAGAPGFEQIAGRLLELLRDGAVVAHNAPFDLSFLTQELTLAGMPVPAHVPVIDTLAIARRHFSFPSNSLGTIAAALDIGNIEHRALSDALTTRTVLANFVEWLTAEQATLTLRSLLALQGGSIPWPVLTQAPELPLPLELADAMRVGARLRLSYVTAGGMASERWVDPIEVVARGSTVYLVAFCHLRQERRTFRLDRIVKWQQG